MTNVKKLNIIPQGTRASDNELLGTQSSVRNPTLTRDSTLGRAINKMLGSDLMHKKNIKLWS